MIRIMQKVECPNILFNYLRIVKMRITAAFLLFSVVLQVFGQRLLVVQFYANRNFVARNLCINRSRPRLKCDGLCQLSKKLKEDSRKEESNSGGRFEGKLEFSSFLLNHEDCCTPVQLENDFLVLNSGKPIQRSTSLFHPPTNLS